MGGSAHNFRNGQIAMMSHLATAHPLSGELWMQSVAGIIINSSPEVQAVLLPVLAATMLDPRCLLLLRERLASLISRVWPHLGEDSQLLILNVMPPPNTLNADLRANGSNGTQRIGEGIRGAASLLRAVGGEGTKSGRPTALLGQIVPGQ